jgi:hypothetical protein
VESRERTAFIYEDVHFADPRQSYNQCVRGQRRAMML